MSERLVGAPSRRECLAWAGSAAVQLAGLGSMALPTTVLAGQLEEPLADSVRSALSSAIANKARFQTMREFFGDVGSGDKAGVWEGVPQDRPEFRAETRRQVIKIQKRRKAEEMI